MNSEEITLINCDDEPIHIIGHIQSHAYLLGLNIQTEQINYISKNFGQLFQIDAENCLDVTLEDLEKQFDIDDRISDLNDMVKVSLKEDNLKKGNFFSIQIDQIDYNVILSVQNEQLIVELEPQRSKHIHFETQNLLGDILLQLNLSENSINESLQIVAEKVRDLIQYDRVMVYKFWEDDHGEVVAESKTKELEAFKGLHYPATDVPKQARALYIKNISRIIADVNAEVVPIVSNSSEPLDLSLAQSRAVSPIHIEYLQNMGVKASYSISLVVEDRLWGLIACHNYKSSGFIDYEKRNASKIISKYLSNIIQINETTESDQDKVELIKVLELLDDLMREEWNIGKGLFKQPKVLMNLMEADGVMLCFEDEIIKHGRVPDDASAQLIINFLDHKLTNTSIYSTINLGGDIPELKDKCHHYSGMIAAQISKVEKEYLLFFRTEQLVKVNWAGKDIKEKVKVDETTYRLSPRKSFESWQEEIRGRSSAWNKNDLYAINILRDKILAIVKQKSSELKRLNEKLNEAYQELDSFSYTLSHDLKTPLNTIKGYVEWFMEENGQEDNEILKKVFSNTEIMTEMVGNILEYSKLGREDIKKEKVALQPILTEIKEQMRVGQDFENIEIGLKENTFIHGNPTMVYQIFLNIVENAIKYKSEQKDAYVKIEMENFSDEFYGFRIIDNGIGIDPKHFEKVFGLFKRVNSNSAVEGSGIGLAIVKKIINKHNGRVWVESEVGKGSTFHLILPKSKDE